jgi:anti-anti-sigma factor
LDRALISKGGSLENPIALSGEYDIDRRDELARIFHDAEPFDELFIDLQNVEYIDSSFLTELGLLKKRNAEATITLLKPSTSICRVLHITGFDRLFVIVEGTR